MGTQTMIILSVVGMAMSCHWNQIQIIVSLTNLVQLLTNQRRKVYKQKEDKKQRSELRGNQGGLLEDQRQQFLSLVTVCKESSLQRTAHI